MNYEDDSSSDVRFAGFWLRLAALVVDQIVILVTVSAVGVAFAVYAALIAPLSGVEVGASIRVSLNFLRYLLDNRIAPLVIGWFYWAFFESSPLQSTPGKWILGLMVVDEDGDRVSFLRATRRYFLKTVSLILLGLGFLMAAWTEHKQCLHDKLAHTLVVRR